MPITGFYTPQKSSVFRPITREPKSAELIRTNTNELLNTNDLFINGKTYTLKIEDGYIDAKKSPLSVRIQRDTTKIFERNSPSLTPKKQQWSGTYTGSNTEQSIGYLEPNSTSTLTTIYATKRVRFIRVSGTLIYDPQVSSDTKAEEIKRLLITSNKPTSTNKKNHSSTPDLHLTRYLENLGYDCYLGQDNSENENDIECILLKPKKFLDVPIAKINVNRYGEHSIESNTSSNQILRNTVLSYINSSDSDSNRHSDSESDQGNTSNEEFLDDLSSDDEKPYKLNYLSCISISNESYDESSMDNIGRLISSTSVTDSISPGTRARANKLK